MKCALRYNLDVERVSGYTSAIAAEGTAEVAAEVSAEVVVAVKVVRVVARSVESTRFVG